MLTIAQATAILSILMAFGVDTPTINKVHDILIPTATSTVAYVPVVQTPITPNQPVQFGSVSTTTQVIPVVQSPIIMPNWTIKIIPENGNTGKRDVAPTVKVSTGFLKLWVQVYDKDNKFQKMPVTVTTNDPDIKSPFVMNLTVDEAIRTGGSYVDFVSIYPKTVGTFDFTFTSGDATTTTQVTVTP